MRSVILGKCRYWAQFTGHTAFDPVWPLLIVCNSESISHTQVGTLSVRDELSCLWHSHNPCTVSHQLPGQLHHVLKRGIAGYINVHVHIEYSRRCKLSFKINEHYRSPFQVFSTICVSRDSRHTTAPTSKERLTHPRIIIATSQRNQHHPLPFQPLRWLYAADMLS